ncbi:hypothetical protein CAEBREN_11336 [Caenorhabditis brenneri]|uniref:Uncharacterized protein n=1 Tax=Caenorhabditis brenneri TaxID=135651 RepID=G0NY55_CAEBE|nr:hypothetical protein CAEBREN_11336 [Caenorhabditis brenneri]
MVGVKNKGGARPKKEPKVEVTSAAVPNVQVPTKKRVTKKVDAAVAASAAAPSTVQSSPLQVVTVGGVKGSGPLVLGTRKEALMIDPSEDLLQLDDDSLSIANDQGMLSETELDEMAHVEKTEEVIASDKSDSNESVEPMDVSDGEQEKDFVREPSLPVEEIHQVQVQQPPQIQPPQVASRGNELATQLPPEIWNSLQLLPELVLALDQIRKDFAASNQDQAQFVQKQELKKLLAPLKNLDVIVPKLMNVEKLATDNLHATRGCAGRIDSHKEARLKESAAQLAHMKDVSQTVKYLTGTIKSVKDYTARKTVELDKATARPGANKGQGSSSTSCASYAPGLEVMAAHGEMRDIARSYHQDQQVQAKAAAAAKPSYQPNKANRCIFCGLKGHPFMECPHYRDPLARRQVLLAQGKCWVCFDDQCDSSATNCPVTRRRLCPKCSHMPHATRVHHESLCINPKSNQGVVSNNNAIMTAHQGFNEQVAQSNEQFKRKRTKKQNGQSSNAAAKRSRHHSQSSQRTFVPPIRQISSDQPRDIEEDENTAQIVKKKKKSKKTNRKYNKNANDA